MTLAYGTGDGDDAEVEAALAATAAPLGDIVFSDIAWCAVHQNKAEGTYTFETLFTTLLSGS